jgi:hypothetical protein
MVVLWMQTGTSYRQIFASVNCVLMAAAVSDRKTVCKAVTVLPTQEWAQLTHGGGCTAELLPPAAAAAASMACSFL